MAFTPDRLDATVDPVEVLTAYIDAQFERALCCAAYRENEITVYVNQVNPMFGITPMLMLKEHKEKVLEYYWTLGWKECIIDFDDVRYAVVITLRRRSDPAPVLAAPTADAECNGADCVGEEAVASLDTRTVRDLIDIAKENGLTAFKCYGMSTVELRNWIRANVAAYRNELREQELDDMRLPELLACCRAHSVSVDAESRSMSLIKRKGYLRNLLMRNVPKYKDIGSVEGIYVAHDD